MSVDMSTSPLLLFIVLLERWEALHINPLSEASKIWVANLSRKQAQNGLQTSTFYTRLKKKSTSKNPEMIVAEVDAQ